ncbi:hypothetical protein BT67DRAFT_286448 [Trichocladium antarcticum]|uniref:Uncharacterized protein n=1 Tax=Trichocladium antarcticum TaxID=1450529 RepID=A0AAN6ULF6_9PEZI|nr:hypothetical protein BT67DRAFT_286448 [Trichocladium antarcticum]
MRKLHGLGPVYGDVRRHGILVRGTDSVLCRTRTLSPTAQNWGAEVFLTFLFLVSLVMLAAWMTRAAYRIHRRPHLLFRGQAAQSDTKDHTNGPLSVFRFPDANPRPTSR